jgi:hypothetical protein
VLHGIIKDLESEMNALTQAGEPAGNDAFEIIRADFNARRSDYRKKAEAVGKELENMFIFAEKAFSDGQEMLIIVTELTKGFYSAHFISRHGCSKYFEHNKELLFYERQNEILREIEDIDLGEWA